MPHASVPVREDDWELDYTLSRVPDVPRWTYYPADIGADEARERVARNLANRAEGRGGRFVVERDGLALGTAGIVLRVDGPYLYYAFLPEGRGHGLATEAVRALSAWALSHGADRGAGAHHAREHGERAGAGAGVVRPGDHRGGARRSHGDALVPRRRRRTYSQVTYATVGYDREMTTVGSGRPSAASTGAPREVAIPDEPLTAALDRAAQQWPTGRRSTSSARRPRTATWRRPWTAARRCCSTWGSAPVTVSPW